MYEKSKIKSLLILMMYSLKLLILHKGSYIKNFIKRCNSRGNDPLNVFDSSS